MAQCFRTPKMRVRALVNAVSVRLHRKGRWQRKEYGTRAWRVKRPAAGGSMRAALTRSEAAVWSEKRGVLRGGPARPETSELVCKHNFEELFTFCLGGCCG